MWLLCVLSAHGRRAGTKSSDFIEMRAGRIVNTHHHSPHHNDELLDCKVQVQSKTFVENTFHKTSVS